MAVRAVQVADVADLRGGVVEAHRRGRRADERVDEEQSDRRGECAEVKENATAELLSGSAVLFEIDLRSDVGFDRCFRGFRFDGFKVLPDLVIS